MEADTHRNFSNQYCPRFGKIAVDMGFVTETQLKEALAEQFNNHKLIGSILYEHGWITIKQVDIILDILFKEPV